MDKEEKSIKQPKVLRYALGKVITGTAPAVFDGEDPLTVEEALVEILNKLDKIEKSV